MDGESLQQKTAHKGRKNIQLQDLQRQEGGGKQFWNISVRIKSATMHHGVKAKGCQRHCFYMCGVAQHTEDTTLTPTPANDVVSLQIEQVVYVPNENYKNPLREAKHQ